MSPFIAYCTNPTANTGAAAAPEPYNRRSNPRRLNFFRGLRRNGRRRRLRRGRLIGNGRRLTFRVALFLPYFFALLYIFKPSVE